MFKRNRNNDSPAHSFDTLIGPHTRVQGDLTFGAGLHVDGQVAGNVRAGGGQAAVLSVSDSGSIEGSVEAPHVVLNGMVRGDILARERLELGPKARVDGNVYYGVIEMAPGAQILGKLIHQPQITAAAES